MSNSRRARGTFVGERRPVPHQGNDERIETKGPDLKCERTRVDGGHTRSYLGDEGLALAGLLFPYSPEEPSMLHGLRNLIAVAACWDDRYRWSRPRRENFVAKPLTSRSPEIRPPQATTNA
jgi:hypothetical protein